MRDTLIPFIVTFIVAGSIVLIAYKVIAWWDYRADREWAKEPLSRFDRMDGLNDTDELMP